MLHGVLTGDPQLLAAAPESSQLWTLLPAPVQLHSQGRGIPAALGASPALRKPGWSLPLGVSVTSQSRDLKRLSSHGLLHPLLLAASTPWREHWGEHWGALPLPCLRNAAPGRAAPPAFRSASAALQEAEGESCGAQQLTLIS